MAESQNKFDVVVIGSGPGGYIAAIRCAQLGMKTACVEKDPTFGGTCLNVGCIPSKALLESSHFFHKMKHEATEHGIEVPTVNLQLKKMLARKDEVVKKLTTGVAGLFKKNKIYGIQGLGTIKSLGEVTVKKPDGTTETLVTKNILIATGSIPSSFPNMPIDEKTIVSSTGALAFSEVPKSLLVIGGGYIGLEMGSVWSRLGSKVTVVEFLPKIVPSMDEAISSRLLKVLKDQGIEFKLNTAVKSVTPKGSGAEVVLESKGQQETLSYDKVLVSIGRKPMTEGLGLNNVGLKTNAKGFLEVDSNFKTAAAGIFAIGDVIGGLMLAHKAEEEGVACAEIMAGEKPRVNYNLVPGILYTHPEVATVGKTEEQLKAANVPYKLGQFRFVANGRAISVGETEGLVKLLVHKESDEILGAHIMAANASEMIHELCVAMEFNATAEDIALTMHGHPTLSEAIKEAALNSHDRTLNA
ncbi:MAG: dihydrolipoyl dehydrogenase [Proteobacteria bacterium SG_bin7]|nr:MAG: dihydrolipoyl dehydrogenase [Proteobacteria bacterium SG_bin7]